VICAGQPQHSEVQKIIMLTVDVEPKLKFMEAGAFCFWNNPTGLDFHMFRPPSNQIQSLDIGMQFGVGFEYQSGEHSKISPGD
jgi:hypothetical protein